jgi:hypothetical protein
MTGIHRRGSVLPRSALFGAFALFAAVAPAFGCSKSGSPAVADAAPSAPPSASVALPPPSASTAAAPAAESSDAPVATMKLLDPGQLPRRKLRYAWRRAQHETLTMDLKTSASTEEGTSKQPEIALPPVHIVIAIDPQSASPDGDLAYAWHVTSSAVAADAQTPSSLADGMRAEVAAIAQLSGTAVVTAQGLSTHVTVTPADAATSPAPSGAAGATGQMVEQVRQTLRDVAAPFPEEEVGRGARWEKLSQLASRDARVTQTETFTLTGLTGDTGTLDDLLAQTAPPQPLQAPGAAQARIESMLASGDGKTRFDLARLVPQTKFEGTTTMVVSGRLNQSDDEHDARRMTMMMRVGIVLTGTVRTGTLR